MLTRSQGHAVEIAMGAQAYGGVVSVGGDGTLFEILKGIDRAEQRIALIPAGRGNSLARDLGLLQQRGRLDVIHWNLARKIDLMQVTVTTANGFLSTHLSASTTALGYPAAVTQRARQLAWLGKMSYAVAATSTKPIRFNVRIQSEDCAPRVMQLSGFIANNTRHVANFVAFRKADCSDGQFETMEMDAGVLKQTAHNLSALSRTGVYEPYAPTRAKNIQLTLEAPQLLMMDGEIFPDVVSVGIQVLPSALTCNGPGAL